MLVRNKLTLFLGNKELNMNITRHRILFAVIALCMSFSCGAFADDRTAEEVLTEIDSIKLPTYDKSKRSDKEFMAKIRVENLALNIKKAKLIGELYKVASDHEQLVKLMPFRWRYLYNDLELSETINGEMQEIIATASDKELVKATRFAFANMKLYDGNNGREKNYDAASKAINSFISHNPEDARNLSLLKKLAGAYEFGSEAQLALYGRIIEDYPDNSKYIKGKIKQASSIGKPFKLKFQDAITGTQINMEELIGQVVVFDFWATWCEPCVVVMPHMKELYAKYHDDGVQFIGISLDSAEYKGGLEALQKYVSENEVPWPQYYQGNGWTSDFSMSWGINSIPALFVVDKDGNLNSVQARGKLEELIPELLDE